MKKLKNSELNRIDVKSFKSIKKTPLIVVLDNIRSLNNIGSIFRTCDAFLVSKIYLCGITAKPPNRKIKIPFSFISYLALRINNTVQTDRTRQIKIACP